MWVLGDARAFCVQRNKGKLLRLIGSERWPFWGQMSEWGPSLLGAQRERGLWENLGPLSVALSKFSSWLPSWPLKEHVDKMGCLQQPHRAHSGTWSQGWPYVQVEKTLSSFEGICLRGLPADTDFGRSESDIHFFGFSLGSPTHLFLMHKHLWDVCSETYWSASGSRFIKTCNN